jgi:aldehyde:ferredoxin oxidoreductase
VESTVEYETWGMMGGNLGISDPEAVMKLNYLCDDFGLDTISTGSTIGFAIDAYEHGMLTEKQVGFPLKFGDYYCAAKLVKMIADGKGIGDVLSKGVRQAARAIGKGSESLAVHVKGLESAAWDARGRKCMGLSYATADVGASHLRGWPPTTDPPGTSALDMVEPLVEARNEKILTDSLVICHFTYHLPLPLQQKIALLNAATGLSYDEEAIHLFAQRTDTLTRMFNVREGISRKDDILPAKFWAPQTQGPRVGMKAFISESDFNLSLERYYEIRGWDAEGRPKDETIRLLGLEQVISGSQESRG